MVAVVYGGGAGRVKWLRHHAVLLAYGWNVLCRYLAIGGGRRVVYRVHGGFEATETILASSTNQVSSTLMDEMNYKRVSVCDDDFYAVLAEQI